jgi:FkbM family methyltransferase
MFDKRNKAMMLMKTVIRELLPPIAYKAIRSFRNLLGRKLRKSDSPVWREILRGPAKGSWIYVPPNRPAFGEMIMGRYDHFIWDFLHETNLECQTVIDIGGHIGYHSMCFSALCGKKGKVYVFEPNNYNLERMEHIFKKNNTITENIEIKRYALSNFKGTTRFSYSKNVDDQTSSGGYIEDSYKPLNDEAYERANFTSISVDVDTLDNFIEERGITNLRIVKIDVEGAEHKVLEGGMKAIGFHKPILLIEVHSVSAMLYVCKILYSLDYDLKILDEDRVSRCFIAATPSK